MNAIEVSFLTIPSFFRLKLRWGFLSTGIHVFMPSFLREKIQHSWFDNKKQVCRSAISCAPQTTISYAMHALIIKKHVSISEIVTPINFMCRDMAQ
jgi:hypothetical protein